MPFSKTIIVESSFNKQRIDSFLASKLETSRNQIQELISNQHIFVNNNQIKANYKLRIGDTIRIVIPDPRKLEAEPEDIPLVIIYEDKDIVVVNKEAGMVVHPAAGNYKGTLVNALLFHIKDLSSIGGVIRPGIVHRLDKDTSGVLVVAKNDHAHEDLSRQFKNREVHKEYLALSYGNPKENQGTIDTKIGRSATHRKRMSVQIIQGRSAFTEWKIIARHNNFLLVRVIPGTGRTHQIRVHLAYKNIPIIGDITYGQSAYIEMKKKHAQIFSSISRTLLHAQILGFKHPRTHEYSSFTADLPLDFKEALKVFELSLPFTNSTNLDRD